MRKPVLLALFLAPALACAQTFVDLDRPGALDAIAASNPGQYAKITNILQAASINPCETLPKTLAVTYGVIAAKCHSYMFLTSYPPIRTITFGLDNVTYVSNVALTSFKPRLHPAVEAFPVKPLR